MWPYQFKLPPTNMRLRHKSACFLGGECKRSNFKGHTTTKAFFPPSINRLQSPSFGAFAIGGYVTYKHLLQVH
uniref:Uncharacterized protein n=1 Tax=Rhizophora mucronata TaxID=61149 RepID=A0A2P2P3F2_RHIMU